MKPRDSGFKYGEPQPVPAAAAPHQRRVHLPAHLTRRRDLFRFLATELEFPGYFGHNWDALEECLRDLSWLGTDAVVTLIHDDVPFREGSSNRQTYLELLADVTSSPATVPSESGQPLPRLVAVFPEAARATIARLLSADLG